MFRRISTSRPPAALAIDLGTARTRIAVPGQGVWLDEPTLLALDRHGAPVAAGWQAWHAGVNGSVSLRWPIRQAHIVNPVLCVMFLQQLLERSNLTGAQLVGVSVPALTPEYDANVLAGCISAATGARVIRVDAAAACAQVLGNEPAAPQLVVDVGAGVCEVAATWDGITHAHGRVDVGAPEYLAEPTRLLMPLVAVMHQVLCDLPTEMADLLESQPLQLVGGGSLLPGLTHDIKDAFRIDVDVPPEPRACLARGLAARLSQLADA
jgi:rod shape-determining protein MreB